MIGLRKLPELAQLLAYIANLIFLAYLLLIASADPKPILISAVAFEVIFFVGVLTYRIRRSKSKASQEAKSALDYIEQNQRLVYGVRRFFYLLSSFVACVAIFYMALDISALGLANFGQINPAKWIYRRIAPPQQMGIHPAFSLELLTGAYIDAGKYSQAEILESTLLQIRESVVGENHELIAAMYANLGDFYAKWNRSAIAESYYLRSIALSKKLRIPQGWGSPTTKLGTLLGKEKRWADSESSFEDALRIRSKIFGKRSGKVAETMIEYSQVMQAEGRLDEAAAMESDAHQIMCATQPKAVDTTLISAAVLIIALLFFWQRDKLILRFAKALKSRQKESAKNNANQPIEPLMIIGFSGLAVLLESASIREI